MLDGGDDDGFVRSEIFRDLQGEHGVLVCGTGAVLQQEERRVHAFRHQETEHGFRFGDARGGIGGAAGKDDPVRAEDVKGFPGDGAALESLRGKGAVI